MKVRLTPIRGSARASLAVALAPVLLLIPGCGRRPHHVDAELAVTPAATNTPPAVEPVAVGEDDWPWWRGPDRNGVAHGPAPPVSWSETTNIVWKVPLPGRGHSSPIVVGDRVYLATAEDAAEVQSVLALDRATGASVWRCDVHRGNFPHSGMHEKSTHANGTLASDGRQLYGGFLNGGQIHASALDLDGRILWQTPLGPFVPKFGYAPSPVLHEGLVIFAADNPGSGYLAAVSRATGELVWRTPRPSAGTYATPNIVVVNGEPQLILMGGDRMTAYNPLTGAELWSVASGTEAMVGTVVARGDLVYASGGYPGQQTVCINAVTHQVVWENRVKSYEQSMLLLGDHLYTFADGGILYCWDAGSGVERWRKRLGGNVSTSLTAHGSTIYATNEEGTTWCFRATPDGYEELGRSTLGEEGFASFALCDGRIYIRTATRNGRQRQEWLYCVGETSRGP